MAQSLGARRLSDSGLPFPLRCFRLRFMNQISQCQGITVIELGKSYDSLDERVLEEFGEILLVEATYAEPARLVLDLTRTGFIGSRFLELVIQAWKRLRQRKGRMALCALQPFCAEVIQTARLDTIWPIYPTRREAIAALRGGVGET